tara:strand:- start:1772 stop:2422 length:651 start_codon:yes stop_codon:yes gene_type:complete
VSENLKHTFTKDNSSTLFNEIYKEHYHSTHGALQESQYVFIDKGLANFKNKSLSIFELGFGTGLNAYLTLLKSTSKIYYDCIDTVKLDFSIVKQLNYSDLLGEDATLFFQLHQANWDEISYISDHFVLHKYYQDICTFSFEKSYDLIYFDAFSPRIQPELWTKPLISKCYDFLNENGLFVTYCAKSSVRKILIDVGFRVEKCPGPPGKREMIRAFK